MTDETAESAPPPEAPPAPPPVIDTYVSPEGYTWTVTVGGNSFTVSGGAAELNNTYDNAAGPFQSAEQAWGMYHISVEPLPAVAQEFVDLSGTMVDRLVTVVSEAGDTIVRIESIGLQLQRLSEAVAAVGLFLPATAAAATALQAVTDQLDLAASRAFKAQVLALDEMMPIRDRVTQTKRSAEIPMGSRPPIYALEESLGGSGDAGMAIMKTAGIAPPPPAEPAEEAAAEPAPA